MLALFYKGNSPTMFCSCRLVKAAFQAIALPKAGF
jgi:hypothetical protein